MFKWFPWLPFSIITRGHRTTLREPNFYLDRPSGGVEKNRYREAASKGGAGLAIIIKENASD